MHRAVIALKNDRAGFHFAFQLAVLYAGWASELLVILNQNIVHVYRGPRLLNQLVIRIKPWCAEDNVEGLPLAGLSDGLALGARWL